MISLYLSFTTFRTLSIHLSTFKSPPKRPKILEFCFIQKDCKEWRIEFSIFSVIWIALVTTSPYMLGRGRKGRSHLCVTKIGYGFLTRTEPNVQDAHIFALCVSLFFFFSTQGDDYRARQGVAAELRWPASSSWLRCCPFGRWRGGGLLEVI